MNLVRPRRWAEKTRYGLVLAVIIACFLWGGGSRLDIPGLIVLQPLAVVLAFGLLLVPGEMRWTAVRLPLVLLAALALVMLIQLVPLPPELWSALPGHGQLRPFLDATGSADVWRPLSLTPDLTLAALVGLSVPAAALIGFASLSEEATHRLLAILLSIEALSAVLGLAQLAGGEHSGFYRYAVTNATNAVGLFANRNHQAVFLVMTWPMLAVWATRRGLAAEPRALREWIAGAGAVALIPMVIVTGSRAALVLAPVGMAIAWWLFRSEPRPQQARARLPGWARQAPAILIVVAVLASVGLTVLLSRAEAFQRMFETSIGEESRLANLPVLTKIAGDFLPFGSGFGSFDPVYRFYEPDALLHPTYLNHAHNDLVELIITGGLPALALVAVLVVWVFRRALALKGRLAGSDGDRFAFLGLSMIVLLLLASLADYPLRTPFHAMLFAVASGWLAAPKWRTEGPAEG